MRWGRHVVEVVERVMFSLGKQHMEATEIYLRPFNLGSPTSVKSPTSAWSRQEYLSYGQVLWQMSSK
jgi:hypothetical protein